ncbi:melanopsin-like [Hydractinia symbiolongicarpus]|uniref:melanopsin-like n=1 Tax=Hydractinia symbiolongicarpus TaxID=13093 RepID=UPI00254F3507|nr:melanopsin-like [Hydractinia symbiolongicarpus]
MPNNATDLMKCVGLDRILILTPLSRINYIIHASAILILCFCTLACNSLYIYTVFRVKKLRESSNVLYILLSVSDLLSSLTRLPIYAYLLAGVISNKPQCFLLDLLATHGFIFSTMSMFAISFISVEVYLAVLKPFLYRRLVKGKVLKVLLLLAWIPCIAIPILVMYVYPSVFSYYRSFQVLFVVIMYACLIVYQRYIYCYIKKNERSCNGYKRKVARIAVQVLAVYGLCFIPWLVVAVIYRFYHSDLIIVFVYPWCIYFVYLNSLFDTFIYGFRSKHDRREALEFWGFNRVNPG